MSSEVRELLLAYTEALACVELKDGAISIEFKENTK